MKTELVLNFFEICVIRIVISLSIFNGQLVHLIWLNHEGYFKIELTKVTGNNIMYNHIIRQVFFHRYHILLVTRGQRFQNCTVLQITNLNFKFKSLSSRFPFISVILNHHEKTFFNTWQLYYYCKKIVVRNVPKTLKEQKKKSNNLIQLMEPDPHVEFSLTNMKLWTQKLISYVYNTSSFMTYKWIWISYMLYRYRITGYRSRIRT